MQSFLMEGRSRGDDWHYPHVGDLPWRFFMVRCHGGAQDEIRLWLDDEGKRSV
jgi:hypothetical protein